MVSNRLISCVIRVMLITMLLISSQVVAVQAAGCVLHGRVIDASTGAAIPQAELRVSNRGLQTVTDDQGVYRFAEVPLGKTTLIVSAAGYQQTTHTINITSSSNYMDIMMAKSKSGSQKSTFFGSAEQLTLGGGVAGVNKTDIFGETAIIQGYELHGKLQLWSLVAQAQLINGHISRLTYGNTEYPIDTSKYTNMNGLVKLVLPYVPFIEIAVIGGYEQDEFTYDLAFLVNHERFSDYAEVPAQPGITYVTKGLVYGGELTIRPSTRVKLSGNLLYSPAMDTYIEVKYYLDPNKIYWDKTTLSDYKTKTLIWRVEGEVALLPSFHINATVINRANTVQEGTLATGTMRTNYPNEDTLDSGIVDMTGTEDKMVAILLGASLKF